MSDVEKVLVWLHGEVKTPPFSVEARRKAGYLLRYLQQGNVLGMPDSRPMPTVGQRCQELRIRDSKMSVIWRVIYRIDDDAIIIGDVFVKKTQKTPKEIIQTCQRRFARYDQRNQ